MHNYLIFAAILFTSTTTSSSIKENDPVIDDLLKQKPCLPYKIYTQENVFCICNGDGTWPNQLCRKTFDPTADDKNETNCEPNGYVTIKCNVCKCNEEGKIDYEHCTKNDCENHTNVIQFKERNDTETRRISRIYYGACKPNTFYSICACKFCYCTEKFKLVCRDTEADSKKEVKVGILKLIECATDVKKDIDALLADENVVYKESKKTTKSTLRKATKSRNKQNGATNSPNSSDGDDEDGNNVKKKKSNQDDYFTHIPFEPADPFGRYSPNSQEKEKKGSSQEDAQSLENVLRDQEDSDSKDEINDVAELEEQGYKKTLLRTGSDMDKPEFKNKGVENFLDPDIPKALRDFRKRQARRNSLMSVVVGQPCVPGSEFTIKCNNCFCLKNGNTLCTTKICRDNI